MIRANALALLSAVTAVACLPEYEQIQGERVLYEYGEEMQPCAGNVTYLDGMVSFLERELALEAPALLRFSWVGASDSFQPKLGQAAAGSHAWAADPINIHELTHAITGAMPARFFTEGVAVAVDSPGEGLPARYPFDDSQLDEPIWDPRATMTALNSGDVSEGTAAAFVTFLLVRHGPERFREFYRGLGGPPTMTWLRGQFRRAYGLELDGEIDTFLAGLPVCEVDADPLPLPECSAPKVAWSSEWLWEHPVSMVCDDPGVVGGIGPGRAWPSFHAVTLEVPVRGYYVLSLGIDEVTARFGPCFGCPWEPRDEYLEPGSSQRTMLLEPGAYYLRVSSMSDEAPELTVRLQRQ